MVPAYKRHLSSVQYIASAQDLLRITAKNCNKMPKRYTFFGIAHTFELAQSVIDNCIKANNTNVNIMFDKREKYLQEALNSLACLSNQLQFLISYVDLEDKKWVIWGEKISECERLIKAVIKSDKERNK